MHHTRRRHISEILNTLKVRLGRMPLEWLDPAELILSNERIRSAGLDP